MEKELTVFNFNDLFNNEFNRIKGDAEAHNVGFRFELTPDLVSKITECSKRLGPDNYYIQTDAPASACWFYKDTGEQITFNDYDYYETFWGYVTVMFVSKEHFYFQHALGNGMLPVEKQIFVTEFVQLATMLKEVERAPAL